MQHIIISDSVQALFDVWLVGDQFLQEAFSAWETIRFESQHDRKKTAPMYLQEYYNVLPFYSTDGEPRAVARIVNSLISGLNSRDRLPKYILMLIDRDILMDIDVLDDDDDVPSTLYENICWVVKQVDMHIRRKKADLLEKKPGAVYTGDPKVVFIRMIRRIDHFIPKSRLESVYHLRAKFNDFLNEEASRIDQRMLTINSCATTAHFDKYGKLSLKGKNALWYEIDELMEWFDEGRIKLLPTPRNPQKHQRRRKNKRQFREDDREEDDHNYSNVPNTSNRRY